MKQRLIAITMFMMAVSSLIHAQVVLQPEVTGYVLHKYTYKFLYRSDIPISACSFLNHYLPFTPNLVQGEENYENSDGNPSTFYYYERRTWTRAGIIEFNIDQTIDGGPFPFKSMTANNWVAQLDGIVVQSGPVGGDIRLDLFNLGDSCEDAAITESDYSCGEEFIDTIFESIPPVGTEISGIDVTEQLRWDLFGPSFNNSTAGFILKPVAPGLDDLNVTLDHTSPRISVFVIGTPTPVSSATPVPTVTPSTSTPTPTVTPSTSTPAPTETPHHSPTPDLSVELDLTSSIFRPGDPFQLTATISSFRQTSLPEYPLVVVLDVSGSYYWYPDWTTRFNTQSITIPTGSLVLPILDFIWPDVSGSMHGLNFYGAVLTPDFTAIVGMWDSVTFGWSSRE